MQEVNGPEKSWAKRILSPVGRIAPIVSKLADRLPSLEGRAIGFWDNSKPGGDTILHEAKEILSERYGINKFVYETGQVSEPITQDQLRRMKETEAVLIASAD